MKPKLAEGHNKILKAFLLVAGISLAVCIAGADVYYVLYELNEIEVLVFKVTAFVALWMFIISTIGSLVIFLIGRRKTS